MVKIGRYEYERSNAKGKKLKVVVEKDGKKKTINFGNANAEHYRDKTGIWSSKDHGDKQRRKAYLTRSAGIKRKDGSLTKDDVFSANYHARRILW